MNVAGLQQHLIRKIDCFANLAEGSISLLQQQMCPVSYNDGQIICKEHEPGDWMFIVGTGKVAVVKEAEDGALVRVATLGEGDFGGMMSLFEHAPRSATLQACGQVTLWVLEHKAFTALLETCGDLSMEMLAFMSKRMRNDSGNLAASLHYVTVSGMEELYQQCEPHERLILDEVNHKVAAADSLKEIIDFIYESTRRISPTNRVALAFVEEDGKRVTAHYARADYEPLKLKAGYTEDLAGSSLQRVIDSGKARVINNLKQYSDEHPDSQSTKMILAEGLQSSMTCPLTVDDRCVGLLFRSSTQINVYDEHQVRLWKAIALRISQVVEKVYRIEQLTEANKAYFEMLGFVSHELKSPVASMVMDARLMLDGYFGDISDKQRNKLERMTKKGHYLLNLVKEYMDLAKLEGGDMVASFQADVPLIEKVIQPAIDILASQCEEKQITLNTDWPDGLAVECDPNLLTIVMVNLIGNACKYGVEHGQVDVKVTLDQGKIKVAVRNTGPGFAPDQRSKLFRRFSRINSPELNKRKGTGVGLYSCWRIIHLHNGRIDAVSELGQWAEFTFIIPQPVQIKTKLV